MNPHRQKGNANMKSVEACELQPYAILFETIMKSHCLIFTDNSCIRKGSGPASPKARRLLVEPVPRRQCWDRDLPHLDTASELNKRHTLKIIYDFMVHFMVH
eukprot:5878445-Amphidinium_carterae.1